MCRERARFLPDPSQDPRNSRDPAKKARAWQARAEGGVRVAPDAHVKNCIIMQDGMVHEGAYIENCILDKQAIIKRNSKLIGPEAYPIVIAKNVVI